MTLVSLSENYEKEESILPPRILIVDDDKVIQARISEILREKGCKVITTSATEEAIKKMIGSFFDIVLVDIGLPDDSGKDIVEMIIHKGPNTGLVVTDENDLSEEDIEWTRKNLVEF
jgi:DNA-binding response OmpR family regulator